MKFETVIDTKELCEMTKAAIRFGPKVVARANRDAIDKGKTELGREVAKRYNMTQKEFKNYVRSKYDRIEVESHLLTVGTDTHFSHTPKKYESQKGKKIKERNNGKKATATIKKKGKKVIKHGFILNPNRVKNGAKVMLWIKEGKKYTPYRSVSAAQMASNEDVKNATLEAMAKKQEERLEHYMNLEMKKYANH